MNGPALVIVSAYFKIPSKQTHASYLSYIIRFFKAIQQVPIVFFTTREIAEEIQSICKCSAFVHWIFIESVFQLKAFEHFGAEFWKKQSSTDPEKHSPELAAIWYEKPHFVLQAASAMKIAEEEIATTVFCWSDVGCIRDDATEKFAAAFGLRGFDSIKTAAKTPTLHLQCIEQIPVKRFYSHLDKSIAGAIMFGSLTAWKQHVQIYNRVLEEYVSHSQCVTKDQHVIRSCVDAYPANYTIHHVTETCCIDPWFFFLQMI